jgi:hypothetical protein
MPVLTRHPADRLNVTRELNETESAVAEPLDAFASGKLIA